MRTNGCGRFSGRFGFGRSLPSQAKAVQRRFRFGQDSRQFPLKGLLRLPVVFIRQFAQSELKLEVAQILVDSLLAIFQMLDRRGWDGLGNVLRADKQDVNERRNRDERCGDCGDHCYFF